MSSLKTYRLYVQPQMKFLLCIFFGIFTLVGILMLSGFFPSTKGDGPPALIGLIFLAVVVLNAYYGVLSIPHTIHILENGHVEFVSIVRRKLIRYSDIISIKPYGQQIGFLLIRTNVGKIRVFNQFDEFHDFIVRVKQAKPRIEIRGC